MSNRLLVNPGTPQAWAIELKPGVNRIGRGADNNFTINHSSVSTTHCEFTVNDDGVLLKDLGSTNGTFVERVPVTQLKLHHGQHVQLGAVDMIFESKGLPPLPDAVNLPADGARIMVANPGPGDPPPPPPPATPPGLRINRPAEGSGSHPPTPPTVPTAGFRPAIHAASASESSGLSSRQILTRGSIGAIAGGLVGMLVWYLLIKFTGYSFSLVAWGVGVVTGVGARLLAKDGSMALGIVCGACALIAIVCGEYYGIRALVTKESRKFVGIAYVARMAYAKEATELKTPEEIRKFLAENHESGEKTPEQITPAEIKEFEEKELPQLRDFVKGKPSRQEFAEQLSHEAAANFDYKEYFFKEDIKSGVFMVLFILLGIATAWKIGAGDAANTD